MVAGAMAEGDQRLLKIEPGKAAEDESEGQSEDGENKVAPRTDPGEAAKKQTEKKLMEQVSAVSDSAQAAEPAPAQAASDPRGRKKQRVEQNGEVKERQPGETGGDHQRIVNRRRAPGEKGHAAEKERERERQEAAVGEEKGAAARVAEGECAEDAEEKSVGATGHEGVPGQEARRGKREKEGPQNGSKSDAGENDGEKGAAVQETDEKRKSEVELLLDGERPSDAERENAPGIAEGQLEILKEECKREPRQVAGKDLVEAAKDVSLPEKSEEIRNQQEDGVNGNDAEETASIEDAEVVGGGAGVEEDATDEETGEDEEKVNAAPGETADGEKVGAGRSWTSLNKDKEEMAE